jgi:hypothetical protein
MCCSRTTSKKESLHNLKNVESAEKVDNNTYEVTYKDGCRAIRLHRTDVVTFRPDGKFAINSGGWQTRVTKNRINKYCRTIQVWALKGKWYVSRAGREGLPFSIYKGGAFNADYPVDYHDHMMFYSDGAFDTES